VQLRVLLIEHSEADAALITAELAAAELDAACERVDSEQQLEEALSAGTWDLLLSDHELPGFGSPQALRSVARHAIDTPFVLVSGRIGEEAVAEALRHGAADYVNKDHLERLGPVLRRVLGDAVAHAEQRQAERATRDAEARMQSLMDHAPFSMSLRDLDGRFQIVNRLCLGLMGRTREKTVGRRIGEFIDHETAETLDTHEREVRNTGEAVTRGLKGSLSDGSSCEYLVTKYPVRDHEGALVGIGSISLDITERREMQDRLREAEDRFRGAFDSSALGMALVAPDGRWLQVNPALCALVGYSSEELLSGDFQAITHPEDLDADLDSVRKVLAGEIETCEMDKRYIHKQGHTIWIHLSVALVRDPEGAPAYFVSLIQDISQQRRAEELAEQLRHSQGLDAIGRLAGGVAHDFNNMLTAIKGYSELMLEALGPDDPLRAPAEQISRAVDQAATLPRQLLAFSRKQPFEPEVVDLNEAMRVSSDMLRQLLGVNIRLVVSPLAEDPNVLAVAGHVEQVLLNLALNGRDAMPNGGTLTLSSSNRYLEPDAALKAKSAPGPYVILTVLDEGVGMDGPTAEHIFEPFFTTKTTGSGLGLSTVYGIAKQKGGFITVDSQPGRGSRFEMWVPCANAHPPADTQAANQPPPEPVSRTVLVAEDEAMVRELTVTVLQGAGYTVLAADSGEEALARCDSSDTPIDVLLTDMVMPGMGGRELAERVLDRWPGTPVVLMSGYTEDAPLVDASDPQTVDFMQKPFAPQDLLDHVAAAGRDVVGSPEDAQRPQPSGTTILVADDHPAVLDSVSRYLGDNGFDVVARASRGDEALAHIARERPAIALLDVRMSPISGIEVARQAQQTAPDTRVVLFTGHGDEQMLEQALDAGVRAFVLKGAPMHELLRALTVVAAGGTYVDPELAGTLASRKTAEKLSPLTTREQEVLALVADGMTNDKAAACLSISPETVQSHIRHAMAKLDADTRTQAVATAFRRSLLV
jgi:two-component system cell cycle sensor histidine kinase/response regulator CckA